VKLNIIYGSNNKETVTETTTETAMETIVENTRVNVFEYVDMNIYNIYYNLNKSFDDFKKLNLNYGILELGDYILIFSMGLKNIIQYTSALILIYLGNNMYMLETSQCISEYLFRTPIYNMNGYIINKNIPHKSNKLDYSTMFNYIINDKLSLGEIFRISKDKHFKSIKVKNENEWYLYYVYFILNNYAIINNVNINKLFMDNSDIIKRIVPPQISTQYYEYISPFLKQNNLQRKLNDISQVQQQQIPANYTMTYYANYNLETDHVNSFTVNYYDELIMKNKYLKYKQKYLNYKKTLSI
jgi:hypothetical protein